MGFLEKWVRKKGQPSPEEGNHAFVQAMQEVAPRDTPENRKRLYSIMLQTMLIVPIPEVPAGLKPGFNTTEGNTQLWCS